MSNCNDSARTRRTPTVRSTYTETGRHPGLASGRVRFDERGNAKWEMRTSGHTYVADGSTTLVRKLVPPLSLERTVRVPKLPSAAVEVGSTPVARPDSRPAKPDRMPTRAEMGTVRTFPVAKKPVAVKPGKAAGARPNTRPTGLIARLFGRKP